MGSETTSREAGPSDDEARHALELLELGDAFFELDRDWRIVRVNGSQERLSGKPRAETVGRVLWEVWPETAAAESRYWRDYHRCMEERVPVQFQDHHAPLDLWTSVTAYPVSTGGIAVFLRDVTAIKRAEQALRRSEEQLRSVVDDLSVRAEAALREAERKYRSLAENAPEVIARFDRRLRHTYVNQYGAAVYGVPAHEVIGRTNAELGMPAEKVELWRQHFEAVFATGEQRVVDFDFDSPTQGRRRFSSLFVPERDEAGEVASILAITRDVTERRRAEIALRESEAKFRSVFEQAAIGMGRVRFADARWTDVNDAFCRMLGRSREELLATPWPDITHPDDVELDLVPSRRMAAGELESYTVERRFLHEDGHFLWARLTLSLVRDGGGQPDHEIAIIEDVTAQKRAEQEVRAAARAAEHERRRLATILETLPAGVAIADAAGAFTHVNSEFKRIWGTPPSPRSVNEYGAWRGWWPDGRPVATDEWALARALVSGEVIVPGDVVDIEKFDGTGRATIINAAAPVRSAEGEIVGGVLTEVDISVQRRAEDAARAAEQRMRSVVEHLPSGLVVADLQVGDLHWNGEALRIHGYTGEGDEHRFLESLVAEHELRTLAGEPVPVSRWPLPRLLAGESFHEYELLVRNTRLGWERVFSYSGVVVHLPGAAAFGLLTIQDVSARSRAEAGLREANERLVEADRRKDEFLGMLSHELRNPLAPIRNALFILDHAAPEGQQARRAKDIATRQVAHLTRLVDDLLDVTRIARGKIELRHEELDLGALVRRTAEDYRPLMQDRGLDLALDVGPDPVLVRGDPARLTQVFGNLLNNAAKFTPAGGRVALSLRREGDRAVAHVADTGPGITPDLLPSLFEPFTQGKQTLARSEGGLGLGLSLVKGLVALHGGEVSVSSRPGAGADFAVSLALSRPGASPSAGAHATARTGLAPTHRQRVLVVDDNRDAAESLGELVRMLGHEVELAYDGPTAVAQASKTHPDLVLCDIGLPGMDGYQVARELRARPEGNQLRLVALSGYAQPEDVARALDAGFDSHVAKPADPSRLEGLLT